MTEKYLYITADSNDGDYVSQINKIDEDDLKSLLPLFEAIKNFKPYSAKGFTHRHNWPHGDGEYIPREDLGEKPLYELYEGVLTSEQIDFFNEDYCPYGENGVHTIKDIRVLTVIEDKSYLK